MEVDATISARTLTLSVESWARSPAQKLRGRDRSVRASVTTYDSHRESIFDGLLGDVIASPETERDKDDSGRYREAQSGVA